MYEKEMCFPRLIVAAAAVVLIRTLVSGAALLPADEVEALNRSAIALGKTEWDFSVDPCSTTGRYSNWFITEEENAVTCNCTFNNNSVCHILPPGEPVNGFNPEGNWKHQYIGGDSPGVQSAVWAYSFGASYSFQHKEN
ncbi:hypothetical protein RJ639_026475, partial [Escallonia herrerae]